MCDGTFKELLYLYSDVKSLYFKCTINQAVEQGSPKAKGGMMDA